MRAGGRFLKDALLGAICAAVLPLAVVAVGWTQALARRRVYRRWHAEANSGVAFAVFARSDAETVDAADPPRWVAAAPPRSSGASWVGALWRNLREGAGAVANAFVLTLPAGTLWLFGWHAGWNHSFHKSYELASVGPLAAALGVMLFVVAMLYLPVAQVHQAVARDARAFYQFGVLRRVIAANAAGCAGLAARYALVSLPVVALKTAPMFFDRFDAYPSWTDAQLVAQLESFMFWSGALLFGGYVWLRLRAATVYAEGLRRAVARGTLAPERLSPRLRSLLARFGLPAPVPPARGVAAAMGGGLRAGWQFTATAVAALLWLAFVAQLFVSEFLNYHGPSGWLHQPLIQLPWFSYLP